MNNSLYLIHYKLKELHRSLRIFSSTVRQYFANNYPHPLFHNHQPNGKSIYRSRGAPFQFKVINDEVLILSLNEGVEFAHSFQWPESIDIPLGNTGVVVELELTSKIEKKASFQKSAMRCYRNLLPYIALNQEKYKIYQSLSNDEKRKAIEKGISNHILTAAKWCGITINKHEHLIETKLIQMKPNSPIKIKDSLLFTPFDVMFECNTDIPDYIGIGKFVSRGYGTVVRYG